MKDAFKYLPLCFIVITALLILTIFIDCIVRNLSGMAVLEAFTGLSFSLIFVSYWLQKISKKEG